MLILLCHNLLLYVFLVNLQSLQQYFQENCIIVKSNTNSLHYEVYPFSALFINKKNNTGSAKLAVYLWINTSDTLFA